MDCAIHLILTDREWALTASFIPPAQSGGQRRTTDMREVVSPLLVHCIERLRLGDVAEVLSADLDGAAMFLRMAQRRLFETINTVLVMYLRKIEGCGASPSAKVIDN